MMRASAYLTSKFAIAGLTEALAEELAEMQITVNAIAPGPLPTTFLNPVVDAGPELAGQDLFADAASRSGQLEQSDVAPFLELLDYLVSHEASSLTGRILSARWETPAVLRSRADHLSASHFRLRRIDDDLYAEVER